MTRLKRTIFSILSMALLATGFVACSSDDATIADNAATEQTAMATKTFNDMVIIPGLPGFGMVSTFAGGCMPASGFCFKVRLPGPGTHSPLNDGISRIDGLKIRLVMSMETYTNNKQYFRDNIFEIEAGFPLSKEVSTELGFEAETVISKQMAE